MSFVNRLLTIIVTATITSMFWIVAGDSILRSQAGDAAPSSEVEKAGEAADSETAEAEPTPVPTATATTSPDLRDAAPLSEGDVPNLIIPVLQVSAGDLVDGFATSADDGVRLHEAIDIASPVGTSVVSSAPGTIEKMFTSSAGGKTMYVRSDDRETLFFYAHLQEYAPGLKEGQKVRRGQRLGAVGITGNANPDDPHLHFAILRTTSDAEWWEPANAVNPFPLLGGAQAAD